MLSWLACLLVIGAEIEVVVGGVLACGVHELGILLEAHHGRWPALPVGRRLHADERKGPDLLESRALTELQRLIQVGWSIITVEPIDANICLGGTVNDSCFSSVDDEKRNAINDRCPNRRGKIGGVNGW